MHGKPPRYFTKPPRPTQSPTLCGTGIEYRPKCGDALRLNSKGRTAHSACGQTCEWQVKLHVRDPRQTVGKCAADCYGSNVLPGCTTNSAKALKGLYYASCSFCVIFNYGDCKCGFFTSSSVHKMFDCSLSHIPVSRPNHFLDKQAVSIRWLFRSFPVIRRYRRQRRMIGNL